ncbi:MAG: hypothetical protein RBR30_01460 [Tenuifilaceae bacterium]|nr:hypothetical protein [Tenuifilaceae bacterium]
MVTQDTQPADNTHLGFKLSAGLGKRLLVDFGADRSQNTSINLMRNAQYLLKPSVDLSAAGYLANQIVDNSYKDFFVGQSSGFTPYISYQFAPK